MRRIPRTPRSLRMLQLFGLLIILACLAVNASALQLLQAIHMSPGALPPPNLELSFQWREALGASLGMLGVVCNLPTIVYSARLQRARDLPPHARATPSLPSAPVQVTAACALLAPLLAILAILLLATPANSLLQVIWPLQIFAALLLIIASVWIVARYAT